MREDADEKERSKEGSDTTDLVGLVKVEPLSDLGVLTLSSPFLALASIAQAWPII